MSIDGKRETAVVNSLPLQLRTFIHPPRSACLCQVRAVRSSKASSSAESVPTAFLSATCSQLHFSSLSTRPRLLPRLERCLLCPPSISFSLRAAYQRCTTSVLSLVSSSKTVTHNHPRTQSHRPSIHPSTRTLRLSPASLSVLYRSVTHLAANCCTQASLTSSSGETAPPPSTPLTLTSRPAHTTSSEVRWLCGTTSWVVRSVIWLGTGSTCRPKWCIRPLWDRTAARTWWARSEVK